MKKQKYRRYCATIVKYMKGVYGLDKNDYWDDNVVSGDYVAGLTALECCKRIAEKYDLVEMPKKFSFI